MAKPVPKSAGSSALKKKAAKVKAASPAAGVAKKPKAAKKPKGKVPKIASHAAKIQSLLAQLFKHSGSLGDLDLSPKTLFKILEEIGEEANQKPMTTEQAIGRFFEKAAGHHAAKIQALREGMIKSNIELLLLNIFHDDGTPGNSMFYSRTRADQNGFHTLGETDFQSVTLKDLPFKSASYAQKAEAKLKELRLRQEKLVGSKKSTAAVQAEIDNLFGEIIKAMDPVALQRLEKTSIKGRDFVDAMEILQFKNGKKLVLLSEEYKWNKSGGIRSQQGVRMFRMFDPEVKPGDKVKFIRTDENGKPLVDSKGNIASDDFNVSDLLFNITSEPTDRLGIKTGSSGSEWVIPDGLSRSVIERRQRYSKRKLKPGGKADFGFVLERIDTSVGDIRTFFESAWKLF